MRLRNVPYAKEKIRRHPELIVDYEGGERQFNRLFENDAPLMVEIGAGKGRFSHERAKRHPEDNHIAIERFDSVIVRALERVLGDPLDNLFLVRMDAAYIEECFDKDSIDAIFLNFPDPWPKARHEKRRLTHPDSLRAFARLLKPKGRIEFKTDNRKLFAYSIKQFNRLGWDFQFLSLDLHADKMKANIMTEFEERYSKNGPIYKLIATYEEE